MVHPSAMRAFTISCQVRLFRIPLTGFTEVCLTRQQFSLYVAACTLAKAADQSPPALSRRQARPFTAELAPAGVSPSQSLLSLLGPTTYCRGGILTRSRIKERRLHQEDTESTEGVLAVNSCVRQDSPELSTRRDEERQIEHENKNYGRSQVKQAVPKRLLS